MDPKIFCAQFSVSAVIVFLGNTLEMWIPNAANAPPTIKRAVYWILAAVSAVGVLYYFRGSTWPGISAALGGWIQAVVLQEFIYRSTKQTAKKP